MDSDPWANVRAEVQKSVEDALKKIKVKVKPKDIEKSIEVPPSIKMGDLACSISFQIGKKKKISPRLIAENLLAKIKKPGTVKKVKLSGAYLNFELDRNTFAKKVLSAALKTDYGEGEVKKDKIMVEYSQPNPLKAFHVGHIRGTTLGEGLSRILRYAGYDVVKANYYNDLGTHIAKCIWVYLKSHKGEIPKEQVGAWFGKLYAEAAKELEENPDKKEEVSEILKKLSAGEPEIVEVWKKLKELSIGEFERIYKEMDVSFDHVFYESNMEGRGRELVKELQKKKIAKRSQGAVIVNLKKYDLDTCVLIKTDGTALYSTKDLALAEEKFKKFKINRSIYVVGAEQRLYFQQLFKTLELMGFRQAKKSHHLAYELVNLASGEKISSRTGTAILYEDLRNKMVSRAMEEVLERNPEMDPFVQKKIATQIAFGAMKFSMLNISDTKTIFFDWDRALEFEGETGPYLQYAAVRAKRIIEQVRKIPGISEIKFSEIADEEHILLKHISKFTRVLNESAESYKPYILSNYTFDLAEKFNSFYTSHHVIDAESKDLKIFRIGLVSATFNTLRICLYLLGIDIPSRM